MLLDLLPLLFIREDEGGGGTRTIVRPPILRHRYGNTARSDLTLTATPTSGSGLASTHLTIVAEPVPIQVGVSNAAVTATTTGVGRSTAAAMTVMTAVSSTLATTTYNCAAYDPADEDDETVLLAGYLLFIDPEG